MRCRNLRSRTGNACKLRCALCQKLPGALMDAETCRRMTKHLENFGIVPEKGRAEPHEGGGSLTGMAPVPANVVMKALVGEDAALFLDVEQADSFEPASIEKEGS